MGLSRCPPGSLPDGAGCRAVVVEDAFSGRRRVDVGVWASIAFGPGGGAGSAELCTPLALHPAAFDAARATVPLRVRIDLAVPDQDLSRLHANVDVRDRSGRHLPPPAQSVARGAVAGLLEMLRALGGESTAAALAVEVGCTVGAGPVADTPRGGVSGDAGPSASPLPDEDEEPD